MNIMRNKLKFGVLQSFSRLILKNEKSTHSGTGRMVHRVVLTGGPCSGRTTGLTRLSIFFENLGWKVFRVPEATELLTNGGVKYSELTKDQVYQVQNNLVKMVMATEQTYFDLAAGSKDNCLVICDRGVMDTSIHLSRDQWQRLLTENSYNEVDIRDERYHQVIHMVTAAIGAIDFFTVLENVVRSENVAQARDLDQRLSSSWVGHPRYNVIDNVADENFNDKLNRMIKAVCTSIGIEAADRLAPSSKKRKFIVKHKPSLQVLPPYQEFTVVHDYLVTPNRKVQARIRKRGKDNHWTYTHTIQRPEINKEVVELKSTITQQDYVTLLAQSDEDHYTIYKKRLCFLWNSQYFHLDIYEEPCHPRCKDLVLLETYTPIKDDSLKLPPFLEVVSEVTDIAAYSMYNLSSKN